jgi:hypothetical protein
MAHKSAPPSAGVGGVVPLGYLSRVFKSFAELLIVFVPAGFFLGDIEMAL